MPARREDGMVTVETAIVLPALVAVLAGALWLVAAVTGQLRCVDAAREAARLAARGDSAGAVSAAAHRAAPDGALVRVLHHDGLVTVTVTATVRPFGGWAGRLPTARLIGSATAADETATPGSGSP